MKAGIKITFAIIFFSGCGQTSNKEIQGISDTSAVEKPLSAPTMDAREAAIRIENLAQLIPIDTVNSESQDVFKKYGLEFNGNCYACDLAHLSITEKAVSLTNVCDEKITQSFEMVQISGSDHAIEIKTGQGEFILTEIDKAPIYELKTVGKGLKIENLRLSRYYTLKKLLNRFEQHDCGEFEG